MQLVKGESNARFIVSKRGPMHDLVHGNNNTFFSQFTKKMSVENLLELFYNLTFFLMFQSQEMSLFSFEIVVETIFYKIIILLLIHNSSMLFRKNILISDFIHKL